MNREKESKISIKQSKDTRTGLFYSVPTLGDGDCAFHAVKGEWDDDSGCCYCEDVPMQRKRVAEAIRHGKIGDKIFKLVQKAIREGIMDQGDEVEKDTEVSKTEIFFEPEFHSPSFKKRADSNEQDNEKIKDLTEIQEKGSVDVLKLQQDVIKKKELESIRELTLEYKKFLKINKQKSDTIWNTLEDLLLKNQQLKLHIENKSKKRTFKEKFLDCLDKYEGETKRLIISDPLINEKYIQYVSISKEEFDWKNSINFKIIEEYAKEHIEKSGKWLLAVEIEIIAYALNIQYRLLSRGRKGANF